MTLPLATAYRPGLMSPGDKAALKTAFLPNWKTISSAYTAASADFLQVNTSSAPISVTLPANPTIGMIVNFSDASATWGTNNLTILNNGSNINSSSTSLVCDLSGLTFYLLYQSATVGWKTFLNSSSTPGIQGIPGNGTIPTNAVAGNIPIFTTTSGLMSDSGIALSSLATNNSVTAVANNLTTTNNNLTTTNSNLTSLQNLVTAINNAQNLDEIDIRYLFLKTSALSGTQLGMIDGIVDPYNNTNDINTTSSLNYLFNSTNGTIGLASNVGTQFLTVSTGSQAISGGDYNTSYPASYAFDGSYSNSWASSQSGSAVSGAAYIGQDFGSGNTYAITQVQVYQQSASQSISSVFVEYSDNLTSWTTIQTTSLNSYPTVTTISIPTSTGSHRAWRIRANGSPSSNYWQISELPFQISIPTGTNVANSSQAIADSTYSGQSLPAAFDGNTVGAYNSSSSWSSNTSSSAAVGVSYIGQDFGAGNSYSISTVVIYNTTTASYAPTSILLQYSDNLSTWTTAGTYSMSSVASYIGVFSVPTNGGSHRAWRLLQNSVTTNGGGWNVAELQMLVTGVYATVSNSAQAITGIINNSYPASQAFDQNFSTFWYSNETGSGVNGVSYIGQDFGSGNAYSIGNIVLTQYNNSNSTEVSSVLLQYTDTSGGSWTTAATINNLPLSANTVIYNNNNAGGSHRFWRLLANSAVGSSYSWGVSELQFQVLLSAKQVSTAANAISGGDYSGYPVQGAFDNNIVSIWASSQTGTSVSGAAYIGQDFGSGNTYTISCFSLTQIPTSGYGVTSVLLQYADTSGSTLGSWNTAGTYAINSAVNSSGIFIVPSSIGSHRAWRLLANSNLASGNQWDLAELVFYTTSPPFTGMTIQSTSLSSPVASPSSARVFIQVDSTSVNFTLNSDLIAYFSRDGGTTFTQANMYVSEVLQDGTVLCDTGSFSLSAQPTGNSTMTYKIVTANSKAIVLTGAGMQVRP